MAIVLAASALLSCRAAAPVVSGKQPTAQPTTSSLPRTAEPTPPSTARVEPQAIPAPSIAPMSTTVARQRLHTLADSLVNDHQFANAHWGVVVIDAERGDTLYSHNANKLFMPASNEKIVTGAVGLTQLGADYQWRTVVELRGEKRGATFVGDVVVHGRGDPSWSDALHNGNALTALSPIADALSARGITRLAGQVVAEGNAFSDEVTGFGWAFDDFDFGYSAPIDELLLNEGFFRLTVRAGHVLGKPVLVSTAPTSRYPRVVVQAVARERRDSTGPGRALVASWDSTTTAVMVTGTLPMDDSTTINVSYRHPNDAVVTGIRETLVARGIQLVAPPVTRSKSTGKRSPALGEIVSSRAPDTLVVLTSPPLRDVLKRLEKPSQNQLAEMLYKTIGLERTGVGSADSARAIVQRQLLEWGVAPEDIAVRDGSGLSRHDYVSPRTLVRVLDVMRQSPAFADFYAALPVAGVDGTLASRMKGTAAQGNAHAKTGSVDKARSLSGYVTTADGHVLIFSMLCNNFTVPTRAVEHVQDTMVEYLANLRVRDGQTVKP